MSLPIPTTFPERFAAGTTLRVQRHYSDFPRTGGWTATLRLAGASLASVTGQAGTPTTDFLFTMLPAATAPLVAGTYELQVVVSDGTDSWIAERGKIVVEKNIAAVESGELQSWEEKTLPVVEAALSSRLTVDQQSYQIAGRAVTKIPIAELLQIRADLRRAIRAKEHPGELGPKILVTFSGVNNENAPNIFPDPSGLP